jgi:DNA replication protein DnaC
MVLMSNLDFTERGEAFASNKMIGAVTLNRLRHGAYRVVLDGESYRSLRPTLEKAKSRRPKGDLFNRKADL